MTLTDSLVQVDEATDNAWKNAVDDIIIHLAYSFPSFTSDDIWEELFADGYFTPEHRAMGPRILAAVKAGVIEYASCGHCGTAKVVVASRREESHSKNTTVYTSLLYRG